MPPSEDFDRLVGAIAHRDGDISPADLEAAFRAAAQAPPEPLADVLQARGLLSKDRRMFVEKLAKDELDRHHGDVARALAAVETPSIRETSPVPDRSDEYATRIESPPRNAVTVIDSAVWSDGSADAPDPGEAAVGERYRILRPHAAGGLGQVSVALDSELNREIALKEIRPEYAGHADARGRFLLEAEVTGGLEHPGIVPVYGLGTYADGRPYYAMRFIKGSSLQEALDRFHGEGVQVGSISQRNLEQRKLLNRFVDVCNAVAYAHSRGVLHRDLKPSNVMLGKFGETLVVDWGLAKVVGHIDAATAAPPQEFPLEASLHVVGSDSSETRAGSIVGTPGYLSPEQAVGRLDGLGPATDVYGLGAILFHVLCGRSPVSGPPMTQIMKTARGEIDEPRAVNPSVPRPLEAICLKALSLDPGRRYASADTLASEVERYLADEPVTALPDSWGDRFHRFARKHRPAVRAAIASLILIAATAVTAAVLVNSERAEAVRLASENATLAGNEKTARKRALLLAEREIEARQQAVRLARSESDARRWADAATAEMTALAKQEKAAREASERAATNLRREVAHNWFNHGLAEYDQGRPYAGVVDLFRADLITRGDGPAGGGYGRVLLDRATHGGRLATLPMRHTGLIRTAVFSTDGLRLLTASDDGAARLWDTATGEPVGRAMKHDSPVLQASFSPDDRWVLTACGGPTVRLWDAADGKPSAIELDHDYPVASAAFTADGTKVVTVGDRGKVQVWDPVAVRPDGPPATHEQVARCLAFDPAGTRAVTADIDGTARLWDLRDQSLLAKLLREVGPVAAATFSPEGRLVATGGYEGPVRLWIAGDGAPAGRPVTLGEEVRSVCFHPDGRYVLAGGGAGVLRAWDVVTQSPRGEPLQLGGGIELIAFSSDGTLFVTATDRRAVQLWNFETWSPVGEPIRHGGRPSVLGISPDGGSLVTAGDDGVARLWQARPPVPLEGAGGHRDSIRSVEFSEDGRLVLTASADGTARLWDADTGLPHGRPMQHDGKVLTATFAPSGSLVVTGGDDGTARLWSVETQSPVGDLLRPGGFVFAVAVSPDSSRILTASGDGTARLWDARTRRPVTKPIRHTNRINAAHFSPDGSRFVTAGDDGTARVWVADDGAAVGELMRHAGGVTAVRFSADGTRILTSSRDGTARVWDAATHAEVAEPMRHGTAVESAAFGPAGDLIVTTSGETVRMWDAATCVPVGQPLRHASFVSCAAFAPGGGRIAVGGDGRLYFWGTPTMELPTAEIPSRAAWQLLVGVSWPAEATDPPQPLTAAGMADNWETLRDHAGDWLDTARREAANKKESSHRAAAATAEAAGDWFAAEYHLRQLLTIDGLSDRSVLEYRRNSAAKRRASEDVIHPASNRDAI